MALPNGDLITTPFDPQMAYPSDRRMQVDTLNSRDSMSMFIRWEGMEVYVLENKTKYILQGGRSNEFWKEQGTGSGTGGTTFVGQFATADLLPTSGRSAGDYAFVGTGDDFVQYNWDNIANEWVMAEGQTDMASEFFHIGYKTPLRRPVIFPLFPKDVLVQESGDFVFSPETSVARFIFVGEVDAVRGIETAAADREIKLVNRTGSDIPLRDKASGIPSGSGMDFGGTDYTWENGSEITLKGNGTYWELAPNNQVAFSDHLDSVNAQVSVGSDGLEVWTGFIDSITKVPVTFKQLSYVPDVVDGRIFRQINGEYFGDAEFLETRTFNVLKFGGDNTGVNFSDIALDIIRTLYQDGDKIVFPHGEYKFQNTQTFTKSVEIDFGNSTITVPGTGFIFNGTLKTTHTTTSNYVNGGNYLNLNNVTGIEVGDLINIVSTELYDTSRTNHYKGGNFIVTKIDSNIVYFNRTMPFSMAAASIEVKIYKPINVHLHNIGVIKSSLALGSTLYGIRLQYCTHSSIRDFNTDGFQINISAYQCNSVTIENGSTGKAITTGANWDGYGISIGSSSNVTVTDVNTESGQHGITTGGREVCYDIVFNSVTFKSELSNWYGFGAHANLYNAAFNDCIFFGFLGAGNLVVNGGAINSIVRGDTLSGSLMVSDDPIFSSFTFNNVDIEEYLGLTDVAQVMTSTRKHTRSIIFNNCQKAHLRLEVALNSSTGKIAELGTVSINNCDNMYVFYSDNIHALYISNSKKIPTDRAITPSITSGIIPRINQVKIDGLNLIGSSYAVGFRLQNVGIAELNRIVCPVGNAPSAYPIELHSVENTILTNSDTSGSPRGINFLGTTGSLVIRNTTMSFLNSTDFSYISSNPSFLSTDRLISNLDGKTYNYITTETGSKLNVRFDDIGSTYIGANKVTYDRIDDIKPNRNYTLDLTYLNRYIRFTYGGGLSTSTVIPSDVFTSGTEIIGEIEGDERSFSAASGVTLRFPEGQGLTAPTGSRFIIKFKSPNDALVTIIKPYASTGATTFPALTDTPANYTSQKNKTLKVNNAETAVVFVADGVDVRNVTDGGSIAIDLTDGFISSRLNFTSNTAVTLQGVSNANGQSSIILVNPHASNNLTIVHNGSAAVKYISPDTTDFVISPKTAARFEIVGNEMYPLVM